MVEAIHYILDWNFDEDRSRIRFGIGLLKSKNSTKTVAEQMKTLMLNVRTVPDYLKLTGNSKLRKFRYVHT